MVKPTMIVLEACHRLALKEGQKERAREGMIYISVVIFVVVLPLMCIALYLFKKEIK